MKLAEALLERADLNKRVEQLQSRIVANASHQEGEPPTEDAGQLLDECIHILGAVQKLVIAINRTNSATIIGDGRTMTALLAERESLRAQHSIFVRAADAASGSFGHRQMRSELRQIAALPVKDVRAKADVVAQQLRELDVVIQRTNWEADLLE